MMPEDNEELETEVVDSIPKEEIEATYHRLGEAVIDQQFKNRILAFTILLIAGVVVLIVALILYLVLDRSNLLAAHITVGTGALLLVIGLFIRWACRRSRQKNGTDEHLISIGKDIYEASIEGLENRLTGLVESKLLDTNNNPLNHHFTSMELLALLPSHIKHVSILRHEVALSTGSIAYTIILDSDIETEERLNLKNPGDVPLSQFLDELSDNKEEMIHPNDGLDALDDFSDDSSDDDYNSDNNFPDDPFLL